MRQPHDIPQCLRDIVASIEIIEGYLTRIMGEAMNRILKTDPAYEIANARKIYVKKTKYGWSGF